MKLPFLTFLALISVQTVFSRDCPYERFDMAHTYCRVSTCKVIESGVSEEDKKVILDMHNYYRNQIAIGNETRPEPQPSAANMMQLEWDNELAMVAQAHANLCQFKHDTPRQRQVENFSVGQNIRTTFDSEKINWKGAKSWYTSEVGAFYPRFRESYVRGSYGHFSQMIWAKTWKVGCGVAKYKENGVTTMLYTCNYGPAGNIDGGTVYIKGKPCSQCPKNTKCSNEYKGLCKSLTEDGPQKEISRSSGDLLLYCDFSVNDPAECKKVQITGKPFETRKIYSGTYKTVVLNGGESITIKLGKAQDNGGICPFIYGYFGPDKASDAKGSAVLVGFSSPGVKFGNPMRIDYSSSDFSTIGMLMKFNGEMESTIKLEASPGAPPQYFNVKAFGIGKGKCPKFE